MTFASLVISIASFGFKSHQREVKVKCHTKLAEKRDAHADTPAD